MVEIVKFYSENCAPCLRYDPLLKAYCKKKKYKLEELHYTDERAKEYGLKLVPLTVVIKWDKRKKQVGVLSEKFLDNMISDL